MSKTATIKGPDFEQTITLPQSLKEVPLNNYVAFLNEAQKPGNTVGRLAMAVSEFYGFEPHDALQLSLADVQALFKYAVNVTSQFAPTSKKENDCSFEYNGQYFTIPRILPPILTGGEDMPPEMQAIDAIEVQETIRLNEAETKRMLEKFSEGEGLKKDIKPEDFAEVSKALDRRRDLLFSQYLRLVAILTRRNTEPLPVSDSEREAWITTRAVFFKDIDAATALDIDFFLRGTLSVSRKSLQTSGIFIHQTFALLAAMQPQYKRKQKPIKEQSLTGKQFSKERVSGRSYRVSLKADGLRGMKKHR
jgi:hypothetical protein